jgi:CxxC motif-containing protein (DUF1111 family)
MTRRAIVLLIVPLWVACAGDEREEVAASAVDLAACAEGFVRCSGLCLERALVGADCKPVACPSGPWTSRAPRSSRGFVTIFEYQAGARRARISYEAGAGLLPLTPLVALDLHYRKNYGPLVSAPMIRDGDLRFHFDVPNVSAGDDVRYYFTQSLAPNTFHYASPGTRPQVDTAWFERVAGAAAPAEPSFPLTVRFAGRFRDRHRNEWRYDHWVAGYQDGATFKVSITDRGDALDFVVEPAPAQQVSKVDLKWYDVFGPTPLCHDPPALAGLAAPGGMNRSGNLFTYTIADVTPGQLVDVEMTFTGLASGQTYYSEWFHYRVGSGRLERRSQHPWAYAAEGASADGVTIPQFAFAQHIPTLAADALAAFIAGKIVFETDFASGQLLNPPTAFDCRAGHLTPPPQASPLFDRLRGKLGPLYDVSACAGCHHLDGRGRPPEANQAIDSMVVLLAPPDPSYGTQLSHRAVPGVPVEADVRLSWESVSGHFDDGTPYTLRRPRLSTQPGHGPLAAGTTVSVRVAPALVGLGLLEAVPEATILGLADPDDADHDGISGRANMVRDASGVQRLGRFGWKATQPTLRAQAAAAFANDMGLTSAELPGDLLDAVDAYLRGLAVPPRDNYLDPAALRGKALFEQARCNACHVPNLVTARSGRAELRGQAFQAFTDLLLHDLGDGLADAGREWRTAPLWGAGYVANVLHEARDPGAPAQTDGAPNYLHDGRARSLLEAILWHGGEAAASQRAVLAMSAAQRSDLIAYVRFPFADPLPITHCPP